MEQTNTQAEAKTYMPKNFTGRNWNIECAQLCYAIGATNPNPAIWSETNKPMPVGAREMYTVCGTKVYGFN